MALLCPVTIAGAEEPAALAELSLEDLLQIDVVSASRITESRETAPSTVWVVTREQIEQLGLRDLKDVLALVPGVDAIDPHFFLLGGQRGFVGSFSQTLLLVDGREMNNLIAGESFISNQFRTHNIERVEIVNGPGSALYGANALAGVINIITRSGSGSRGVDAELAAGSFDTGEADVIAGGKTGAGLDVTAAISWFGMKGDDFSGFLSDTDRASPAAENNAYRHLPNQYGYSNDSESIFVSLLAERGHVYSGIDFYRNDSGRGTSGIQWDYTGGSDHRDLLLAFAGLQRDDLLGGRLTLRAEYRYYWEQFWGDHTETEGPLVDPATGAEITVGATRDDVERFRGFYSNHEGPGSSKHVVAVDTTMHSSETSTLVGGVTWELADVVAARFARGEGTHPALGPDHRRPEYSNYKYGIYLQDQLRFMSGRLIATIGARYDAHERYDDSFNPRAGLVFRVTDATTVRLAYGEAFREPNVFELQNSESIRPTDLETWEVAWRQRLGTNFSNELVAFRNRADDLIVTDEIVIGGISNKGELDAEGFEDVLSFKFGPLHGFANYTYTTAELTEPQMGTGKVYDIPKHKGNLALMWQLPRGGSAGLTLRWHGSVETTYHDETFRVDDYIVTDLAVGPWSLPGNDAASLQLIVRNLFDADYFHPEPRAPSVVMHPQDGRSVELRLRWRKLP